ncbi:Ca2+-binding RTX toxin-like protein [Actinoplanes campanulatus]|uniref:Ca2+-binding RTX toxin-like protein n=1 Tax=Actinoplanes campanulatus TaxID=113559 RepID=A0A7W5FHB6_9ACTN|nr:calcium-binding protein [Actinoplanes campanulatus]MBB3098322.1 Ca2+-binding RTX toxin-like protein [Actinoplanes campanulatus]GGN34369.1 hypothetical protein GCM10010109_57330 [Actinoplanes campanulatus]GID38719.1 hypothetical protein Aca09nite_52250 [Actinoplanes campanulatus]
MSRLTWAARAGVALLGATATVAMGTGPAQAASTSVASVSGDTLVFQAGSGLANRVVVTGSSYRVTIDDKYKIKAGKGCKAVPGDKTKVTCTGAKYASIRLGNKSDTLVNRTNQVVIYALGSSGNDRLDGGSYQDHLYGGSGNDTISGGGNDDRLFGESGNDVLIGTADDNWLMGGGGNDRIYGQGGDDVLQGDAGNDLLNGGAGNDRLRGDRGAGYSIGKPYSDVLIGGPGVDEADYYTYDDQPVTVDLDGQFGDDGVAGEHDSVGADVENLTGGGGSDILIGNAANNVIDGGWGGADRIQGGAGDDQLLSDAETPYRDGEPDSLDGGTHVSADACVYNVDEDTAINCES